MKKLKGYPCPHCRKLSDGEVLSEEHATKSFTKVTFKLWCCDMVFVAFLNDSDLKHYHIPMLVENVHACF